MKKRGKEEGEDIVTFIRVQLNAARSCLTERKMRPSTTSLLVGGEKQ